MYMNGSPKIRYEIIANAIKQDNNLLNISYLCELAVFAKLEVQQNGIKKSAPRRQ